MEAISTYVVGHGRTSAGRVYKPESLRIWVYGTSGFGIEMPRGGDVVAGANEAPTPRQVQPAKDGRIRNYELSALDTDERRQYYAQVRQDADVLFIGESGMKSPVELCADTDRCAKAGKHLCGGLLQTYSSGDLHIVACLGHLTPQVSADLRKDRKRITSRINETAPGERKALLDSLSAADLKSIDSHVLHRVWRLNDEFAKFAEQHGTDSFTYLRYFLGLQPKTQEAILKYPYMIRDEYAIAITSTPKKVFEWSRQCIADNYLDSLKDAIVSWDLNEAERKGFVGLVRDQIGDDGANAVSTMLAGIQPSNAARKQRKVTYKEEKTEHRAMHARVDLDLYPALTAADHGDIIYCRLDGSALQMDTEAATFSGGACYPLRINFETSIVSVEYPASAGQEYANAFNKFAEGTDYYYYFRSSFELDDLLNDSEEPIDQFGDRSSNAPDGCSIQ